VAEGEEGSGVACLVCSDEFRLEDTVACGGDVAHFLCKSCFVQYSTITVTSGGVGGIPCPEPQCKSPFPRSVCRANLSAWDVLRMEEREVTLV
jgi:hypothetical protein